MKGPFPTPRAPQLRDGGRPQLGEIIRYWSGSGGKIPNHYIFVGGETAEGWNFVSLAVGDLIPLPDDGLRDRGERITNEGLFRRAFCNILRADVGYRGS